MTFTGGESIFQTCETCHAPIIVPDEIFYPEDQQIASGNFATLTNDVEVNPENVTNELTPGENLPRDSDVIDPEAKIERFEVYQEKIGTSTVATKEAVDKLVGSNALEERPRNRRIDPRKEALERIKHELRTGDKIEAIKIYREKYGKSLKEAKEIVEAIEKEELANLSREKNASPEDQ